MINDVKVGYVTALNSIKRGNKKTLALTVFVLSLIFVNLVFLPSIVNGMMDIFVGAVKDYSYGDVVIEPSEGEFYISDADTVLSKIRTLNEVTEASKRLASGATLRYKEKAVGTNILGVNPEEESKISKFGDIVVDGEFLTELSRDEIVLGALIAGYENGPEIYKDLGGVEVGSRINVTFSNGITRQYKVKGIHAAGPEISDLLALIHYSELEDVLGLNQQDLALSIIIRTEPGQEYLVKQKLIDLNVHGQVSTWQDKVQDLIRDILKSFGLLSYLSEAVGITIAAFIIFIIIYINTLNKRKQIGILKAIGITPKSIIFSYMLISLFYTILGIIFGLILLYAIILYLTAYPISFYETMSISPSLNYEAVGRNAIMLVLMSLIAGFIPAWLVTRRPILESIWEK